MDKYSIVKVSIMLEKKADEQLFGTQWKKAHQNAYIPVAL